MRKMRAPTTKERAALSRVIKMGSVMINTLPDDPPKDGHYSKKYNQECLKLAANYLAEQYTQPMHRKPGYHILTEEQLSCRS